MENSMEKAVVLRRDPRAAEFSGDQKTACNLSLEVFPQSLSEVPWGHMWP